MLAGGETGPFRHRWKHRGAKPAKTLHRKVLPPGLPHSPMDVESRNKWVEYSMAKDGRSVTPATEWRSGGS